LWQHLVLIRETPVIAKDLTDHAMMLI
jgi:hypothetical protein